MLKKRFFAHIRRFVIFGFVLLNIISIIHAYKFTHYADSNILKTKKVKQLSLSEKLKIIALGINNPRPQNKITPKQKFQIINLESNSKIEGWYIPNKASAFTKTNKGLVRGTVIIFHGYSGKKSAMLDKADIFLNLDYHVFLIDFMGSGGSAGNTTTIGFDEAAQVKAAFEYIKEKGEKNIILFGTSMGSVAVMKAMSDYQLDVQRLILECPFGTMYQTVCSRFKNMGLPEFPFAAFLVFWGGAQNGFWAFTHNPIEYAKEIRIPTLLLYGEKDRDVSKKEIDEIFANLQGIKALETYPLAGHENYLNKYRKKWKDDIASFLKP